MMRIMRYKDGWLPNTLAITYAVTAYAGGFGLILMPGVGERLAGTVLLAHGMTIAAYLLHEFAHGTVFATARGNRVGGRVMAWITGSCYADFDDLRRKHLRHHADRADVVSFDYRAFLAARPAWLRRLVLSLEWAYIPAVELIMHGLVIAAPFLFGEYRRLRRHVVVVLLVRLTAFAVLAACAPWALLCYAMAYGLFVTVLRFFDAFQHTYELTVSLESRPVAPRQRPDRQYEHDNTYSNLLSARHAWLNLLALNFVYHNVHHASPGCPWYRLPVEHARQFGADQTQVLPFKHLLVAFHRHRLRRVTGDDYGTVDTCSPDKARAFTGADGVSFLTAI